MVDAARLRALLDRLRDETEHLRRLSTVPDAELLADPDKLAAVKYRFVVAIEICIDAGQHVISAEGLRPAADAANVFEVLSEQGVLENLPVDRLKNMARFRNLLVHGYAVVEDVRVLEILKTHLDDFDSFRSHLAGLAN